VALLVAVIAPVAEEFFFRGFFFGALRNWKGPWPAAVITGLVFGGIHAGSSDPAYLVPLAGFGFALCALYVKTGSLYPCIGLHCANNSVAFGVTQNWSWQIPALFAVSIGLLTLLARAVERRWDRPLGSGGTGAGGGLSARRPGVRRRPGWRRPCSRTAASRGKGPAGRRGPAQRARPLDASRERSSQRSAGAEPLPRRSGRAPGVITRAVTARIALALAPVTALVALAAPAAAQTPQPSPAPAAAPATGHLRLAAERVGGGRRRALVGAPWRVRGRVRPFVAGQSVVVRFYRRGHKLRAVRVAVQPSRSGRTGWFVVAFATRRPGRVVVRASHRATPQQRTFRARTIVVRVVPPSAGRARAGRSSAAAGRAGVAGLRVGARGRYDARTARAVLAFRKVVGMRRTFVASPDGLPPPAPRQGRFRARFRGTATTWRPTSPPGARAHRGREGSSGSTR
jgi:hypothetical protein